MSQGNSNSDNLPFKFAVHIAPDAEGISFSPDCKISVPEDGLVVKHEGEVLAVIPSANVEIVTDRDGHILYLSLVGRDADKLLSRFYKGQK